PRTPGTPPPPRRRSPADGLPPILPVADPGTHLAAARGCAGVLGGAGVPVRGGDYRPLLVRRSNPGGADFALPGRAARVYLLFPGQDRNRVCAEPGVCSR